MWLKTHLVFGISLLCGVLYAENLEPAVYTYGVIFQDTPVGLFQQHIEIETSGEIQITEDLRLYTVDQNPHIRSKTYRFNNEWPHRLVSATSTKSDMPIQNWFDTKDGNHDEVQSNSILLSDLLLGQHIEYANANSKIFKRLANSLKQVHSAKWLITTGEDTMIDPHHTENVIEVDETGTVLRIRSGSIEYMALLTSEAIDQFRGSLRIPFESILRVSVTRAIPSPRTLKLLKIRFRAPDLDANAWLPFLDELGTLKNDSRKHRVVRQSEIHDMPLLQHATHLNRLNSLVKQIHTRNLDIPGKAAVLVQFIHDYLEYVDQSEQLNLAEIIDQRRGDCTEFAELYRALGDHLGLTVTTVFGLVYEPESRTFQPHAWNEVAYRNMWIGVDATFNQTLIDATHIPFPSSNHAALMYDLRNMEFEIEELHW